MARSIPLTLGAWSKDPIFAQMEKSVIHEARLQGGEELWVRVAQATINLDLAFQECLLGEDHGD